MTAPLLGQGREVGGVEGRGQRGHTSPDVESLSLNLSQSPCCSRGAGGLGDVHQGGEGGISTISCCGREASVSSRGLQKTSGREKRKS